MLLVNGKIHNIQRKKTNDYQVNKLQSIIYCSSANITKANEKNVRLKKKL